MVSSSSSSPPSALLAPNRPKPRSRLVGLRRTERPGRRAARLETVPGRSQRGSRQPRGLQPRREAALPAEQRYGPDLTSSPSSGRQCWSRNARLADLLSAAAALVAELELEEPVRKVGASGPQGDDSVTAVSRTWETEEMQPACASAILLDGRDEVPAKLDLLPKLRPEVPVLKKQLPFVREFTAAGGDWMAFRRRFTATCDLTGWTKVEELRALPTTLDDNALAAFYAIPPEDRVTLPQAFSQMAAIFDPPSNVRHKFATGRWGKIDMPFAFCSALMPLAQAAYPKMEQAGLDSVVLERMLALARELNVALPAMEEDDLSSLKVARGGCMRRTLRGRGAPPSLRFGRRRQAEEGRCSATRGARPAEGDLFSPKECPYYLLKVQPAGTRLKGMLCRPREILHPAVLHFWVLRRVAIHHTPSPCSHLMHHVRAPGRIRVVASRRVAERENRVLADGGWPQRLWSKEKGVTSHG
ncbi:unnamed protein product [Lampetra fluviatilis]